MSTVEAQLKEITKSLAALSKRVESTLAQLDKEAAGKTTPGTRPQRRAGVTAKRQARQKKTVVTRAGQETVLDQVYDVIKKSRKGAKISKIKESTSLKPKQISNALYKLTQQGKIEAISRGVYAAK